MAQTLIPHKIHYCWFGHNPKPKLIQKCIASWSKMNPDWEIIEWNESNYDVTKIPYIAQAYEQHKWAFVVDFARFDILNNEGGIFLDADVECLKPFPDEMLELNAFSGFENGKQIAPGLAFGSVPGHPVLKSIMEEYYKRENLDTSETICDIVTGLLVRNGLQINDTLQTICDVTIYPSNYFCCFDHETQSFDIQPHTVSIHHYFASWSPWYRKAYFKCIKYAVKILGKKRYLKIKRLIKR